MQQDPYQQFYSSYTGMGNDPVNTIDPSGGIGIPCPGTSALSIFLDGAMYAMGNALNVISKAGNIASITLATTETVTVIGNAVGASDIVNGQLATNPAGSSGGRGSGSKSAGAADGPDDQQADEIWYYKDGIIGNDPDHDMDQTPHDDENDRALLAYRCADAFIDGSGEGAAYGAFYAAFHIGSFFDFGGEGDELFDHFVSGDGSRKDFDEKSFMAGHVSGSEDFKRTANSFEDKIRKHLKANKGSLKGFEGDDELRASNTRSVGGNLLDLFSWTVMGGYKKISTIVTVKPGGSFSIKYKLQDHFGAGVSDTRSVLPGLSALYYLQHYRGGSKKYRPFHWGVKIAR